MIDPFGRPTSHFSATRDVTVLDKAIAAAIRRKSRAMIDRRHTAARPMSMTEG